MKLAERFKHFSVKTIGTLFLLCLMSLCAYIQWEYNISGSHAFTSTEEERELWALSLAAILALTGMCVGAHAVSTTKKHRRTLTVMLIALSCVLIFGGVAGRLSSTQNADRTNLSFESEAASMERQAHDIRAILAPTISGLEQQAASNTGKAARDRLDSARSELDRAAQLEQQAAQIRRTSSVDSSQVFGGFTALFFAAIQFCIEAGFAICAHYLARLFGGEIRRIIINLRDYQQNGGDEMAAILVAAEHDAESVKKKLIEPPQSSGVSDWVKQIEQAIWRKEISVSKRGTVNRGQVRARKGGNSAEAEKARQIVTDRLKKRAA